MSITFNTIMMAITTVTLSPRMIIKKRMTTGQLFPMRPTLHAPENRLMLRGATYVVTIQRHITNAFA